MKQHITQEQMDELSPVTKIKLADWADPQDDLGWERHSNGAPVKYHLPLLTIGEMIAFIDEHVRSGWWTIERSGDKTAWRTMGKYAGLDGSQEEAELCDVLWHQVKLLLSEEQ